MSRPRFLNRELDMLPSFSATVNILKSFSLCNPDISGFHTLARCVNCRRAIFETTFFAIGHVQWQGGLILLN